MNFKTTLILLVLLLGLGAYIFFFSGKGGSTATKTETKETGERKLFEVKAEDITKVTVAPASGNRLVLQKDGAKWRIAEPVSAEAESFEVDNLTRTIADLKAHGVADAGDAATGLATPRYKVDFATKDNKTHTINVGNKSAVGDNLYVALAGSTKADVVPTELLDRLEKPASTYRNPKLVNMTSSDVKQLTIQRADGTIKFAKSGEQWRIIEPKEMPAELSEVDDVVFAVTGLRAADWVAEDQKDLRAYQLDNPRVTVTLSASTQPAAAAAPSTQASTQPATQPTVATVKIGRYDDVLRKNVLASSSDTPAIAKVAASVVETLSKKPIEFRDRKVLQIASDQVSGLAILADIPATTQPATKPASKKETVIKRNVPQLPVGIAAPSTQTAAATTAPATTRPATQASTQPAHKWEIVAETTQPADDSKVDDLLSALSPLRAEKYLESNVPATQPTPTYTLKVTTQAAGGAAPQQHTITIVDPGEAKNPVATYEDLTFEVNRSVVEKLTGEFKKTSGSSPNVANTTP